jgi:membrane associated rhomboid family serine protease
MSTELKYKFARLSIAEKLIVVNVAVFILNALLVFLFQLPSYTIMQWFEIPTSFSNFITQPWSIVTYAFFHGGFFHLFWNMLLLFYMGRIFLNLFDGRKFLNVYFLGAIAGGLLFLLSYNLFPVFLKVQTALIGASAAVMAVLIFVCTYIPNQEIRVFFFNIKLWYVGAFFVVVDLVQIPISNAGGHIAHLGGALLGYVYAKQLVKGNDIGSGFAKFMDAFASMFMPRKRSPLKTVHKNKTKKQDTKPSKPKKSQEQHKIDEILDKISKSGYDSLTKEEKDFLFKVGKDS